MARTVRGPRCHLQPDEKAWIEGRLIWLKEEFGSEPIRRDPLEPGSALLPKKWDGSYEAGADLLGRLCEFMRVDPGRLLLDFYSESEAQDFESAYAGAVYSSCTLGLES